jgi:hypothetical protein
MSEPEPAWGATRITFKKVFWVLWRTTSNGYCLWHDDRFCVKRFLCLGRLRLPFGFFIWFPKSYRKSVALAKLNEKYYSLTQPEP